MSCEKRGDPEIDLYLLYAKDVLALIWNALIPPYPDETPGYDTACVRRDWFQS